MTDWEKVKEEKRGMPLVFVHTPKCGGTYVGQILQKLKIKNKFHRLAVRSEGINFTVIRDPVERFESLINYRLEEPPCRDWPSRLLYAYDDKLVSVNEIVNQMTDDEMTGFTPYRTLEYWSNNVDIVITIDKLQNLLNFFGFQYEPGNFSKVNTSKRERGRLGTSERNRIARLYARDIVLFNKVVQRQRGLIRSSRMSAVTNDSKTKRGGPFSRTA